MAITENVLKEVGKRAVPFLDASHFNGLLEVASKARVVMLGEASHGSHDFYLWRSLISQRLISEYGFHFVAVEGDWPAAQHINREVLIPASRGSTKHRNTSISELLKKSFNRWPAWMWANKETEAFLEWARGYNANKGGSVRFYGLDIYSLFDSIDAVLNELEKIDPVLAKKARSQYSCFDPYGRDEQEYMNSLFEWPEGCRCQALKVLNELRKKHFEVGSEEDDEMVMDVKQNAKIAAGAEKYYRAVMFGSSPESWNVRDRHMMETLDMLLQHTPDKAKVIVWAHNTHIGDYRDTSMAREGSVNLGGLARERYGKDAVVLVGFGTHRGSVIASEKWGGPVRKMMVPPAKEDTYDDMLHRVAQVSNLPNQYYMVFERDGGHGDKNLEEWRGQRAIGVVYSPSRERWGNYVPTRLARRYDAFIFVDASEALHPLANLEEYQDRSEIPESWPTGV
ncbi:hypothetical protein L7F22_058319 [Adiantum nelumboides]|nr:hypothetical protein [Adiantum nelumboides]